MIKKGFLKHLRHYKRTGNKLSDKVFLRVETKNKKILRLMVYQITPYNTPIDYTEYDHKNCMDKVKGVVISQIKKLNKMVKVFESMFNKI